MTASYKLGIHVGHNASCALMKDGEILYVGQEERFCQKKNIMNFPFKALKHGFEFLGITGSDIEGACYTTIDAAPLLTKANYVSSFSIRDYSEYYGDRYYRRKMEGDKCVDYLKALRDDPQFNQSEQYFDYSFLDDEDVLTDSSKSVDAFRAEQLRFLSKNFDIPADRIQFADHHTCHAYYGYYASPFRDKDAAVLVLDGWGDGCNQTVWSVKDNKLECIARSSQNDIGRVYKMATLMLGMRPDEHEYKVMGLAPYAKDSYVEKAYEALKPLSKVENMSIVEDRRPQDLYAYLQDEWLDKRFDNIGGAVQKFTEDLASEVLQDVHDKTGVRRFVTSGGISMNVKMHKVLAEMDVVDDLYVCGSGADESLSVGGCYWLNEQQSPSVTPKPVPNLYLGFNIDHDLEAANWDDLAQEFDIKHDATPQEVAQFIAQGEVIGRVNGRAEFGARSLGNRSILADPSKLESVYKINEAVKQRDFWMPFALSILQDYSDDYLVNPKNIYAPFMTIAFDTKPENYEQIKAGTHPYDKTVRPQMVSQDNAPVYYALIDAFREETGIPALLNTSFNLHGRPIVNTLEDALFTIRESAINHLYIGSTLISKR